MRAWVESQACQSRSFCDTCRLKRVFREQLHRQGIVATPDFPCPHGVTMANLPIPSKVATKGRCLTCEQAAMARAESAG